MPGNAGFPRGTSIVSRRSAGLSQIRLAVGQPDDVCDAVLLRLRQHGFGAEREGACFGHAPLRERGGASYDPAEAIGNRPALSWIGGVRPSRRPLRALLRMRNFFVLSKMSLILRSAMAKAKPSRRTLR